MKVIVLTQEYLLKLNNISCSIDRVPRINRYQGCTCRSKLMDYPSLFTNYSERKFSGNPRQVQQLFIGFLFSVTFDTITGCCFILSWCCFGGLNYIHSKNKQQEKFRGFTGHIKSIQEKQTNKKKQYYSTKITRTTF